MNLTLFVDNNKQIFDIVSFSLNVKGILETNRGRVSVQRIDKTKFVELIFGNITLSFPIVSRYQY